MANGGTNTIAKTLNLGGFGGKLQDFVDNYGTLIGAAGQLASTESAVNKLEGLELLAFLWGLYKQTHRVERILH